MRANELKRRIFAAGTAAILAMGTMAGAVAVSAEETEESVTINWYRETWHTNPDEELVEEAINEYIEPLIGVKVNIMNSAENTELGLSLAAGDDIDVYWCDYSTGVGYIRNNSALDVTELLNDYPDLKGSMPEKVWEVAKTDGKNYYIPNYKECATGTAVAVPKALVEKYGWDLSTVKEWKDLTPLFEDCYADGMKYTFTTDRGEDFFLMDVVSTLDGKLGVRRDDPTKIVDVISQPEYEEHLKLRREWNKAGYVNQAETKPLMPDQVIEKVKAGENAFSTWYMVPDSDSNASIRYGTEMVTIPMSASYMDSNSPFGSCYMINANTEKTDAAMKFLTLLNTDETLANMATFGIEGRHWNKTEDGKVELIPDSGYSYSGVWICCNVMAPTLLAGESDDKKEQYAAFNDAAEISCTAGFRFDPTNVEAELAAVKAADDEYAVLLLNGFYDAEDYLEDYRKAREKAGLEKIMTEMQAQYDAWLAVK